MTSEGFQAPVAYRWARLALYVFLGLRLLLAGLTLRDPTGGMMVDSTYYLNLSQGLVQTGHYLDPSGVKSDLLRPPGYSLLLASIDLALGNSTFAVSLVQLLLTGGSALLLLAMGGVLERRDLGLISAWVLALSPNVALWSLTVMSESLFVALLALSLFFWVRGLRSSHKHDFALAGLTLGSAAMVRPIGVLLIPIWAVATYWALRSQSTGTDALARESTLLAAAVLVVVAWMLRNQVVHGSWTYSSAGAETISGFNLAYVVARGEGITRSQAAERLGDGPILELALRIAAKHPSAFFQAQVLGVGRTVLGTDIGTWGNVLNWDRWSGLGLLTGLLGRAPPGFHSQAPQSAAESTLRIGLLIYSFAFSFGLLALSLLGLIFGWREGGVSRSLILMCAITAGTLMLSPFADGQARFRVPAEPFLALLAAYGWIRLAAGWRRLRRSEGSGGRIV